MRKELKHIINGGNKWDVCWCPLCQDDKKPAYACPWTGPDGRLVCVYGACAECGTVIVKTPPRLATEMMDRIESRLLARYPNLYQRLPPKYSPGNPNQT